MQTILGSNLDAAVSPSFTVAVQYQGKPASVQSTPPSTVSFL